jgi:hypothetical protein
MSRRIVPGTFWVGILLSVVLLLADRVWASRPSDRVPNLLGAWDGFFQEADSGALGLVRSDITQQVHRRIAGDGVLLDLEGRALLNAYNFSATVVRDDFVHGTGVTGTGRLVFQAGLETYAPQPPAVAFQTSPEPRAGDAAVMYPEFHFVPSRGGASRISALLLHPFSGVALPDISGGYDGPFVSLTDPITGNPPDPTFRGIGRMQISPRNRGSFAGRVELFLDPDQPPIISWHMLATTSDDRRVIWMSQGAAGRIIYDGVVVPEPGAGSEAFRLDGVFRLLFNNGRSLYNAYNCPLLSR